MWAGTPISWMMFVTMLSMLVLSGSRLGLTRRLSPPRISSKRSTKVVISQGFSIRYLTPRFAAALDT